MKYPDAEQPLDDWYSMARRASWQNLAETRRTLPTADSVGDCTIFNIGGNRYRLIVKIKYATQRIFIRFVMTHVEYDKKAWYGDCSYKP